MTAEQGWSTIEHMPTENTDAIQQHKEQILKYVSDQLQHLDGCPVCHGHEWNVPGSTFIMQEVNPKGLTGNVFPVVLAFCKSCGYIMTFSAQMAGATKDWPFRDED